MSCKIPTAQVTVKASEFFPSTHRVLFPGCIFNTEYSFQWEPGSHYILTMSCFFFLN